MTISIGVMLTACSSDDTFRGNKWGSTVKDVIKKEKKAGNSEYDLSVEYFEKLEEEVTGLDYDDVKAFNQKVTFMLYEFKKELNGEVYDEPVLFEATYFLDEDTFNQAEFFTILEREYGEPEVAKDFMREMVLRWYVGDSRISYSADRKTLSYKHKSEPLIYD
jgi:hypothetical protein